MERADFMTFEGMVNAVVSWPSVEGAVESVVAGGIGAVTVIAGSAWL